MNTAARRAITLGVAIVAVVAVVVAMLLAPRFFTGEPEASYTPASAQLAGV